MISKDLLEAYQGHYANHEDEACDVQTAEEHIQRHTPQQRLDIYLTWNGIHGYTDRVFAIATGEL